MKLTGPARNEATRLGHQWFGVEHLLLALLQRERPSLAGVILGRQGLTYDGLARDLESLTVGGMPPASGVEEGESVSPDPRYQRFAGWVEGFAAALSAEPSAELALVGICWLDRPPLLGSGLNREAVLAALGDAGVPLPATELPPWEPERPPHYVIDSPHGQGDQGR